MLVKIEDLGARSTGPGLRELRPSHRAKVARLPLVLGLPHGRQDTGVDHHAHCADTARTQRKSIAETGILIRLRQIARRFSATGMPVSVTMRAKPRSGAVAAREK